MRFSFRRTKENRATFEYNRLVHERQKEKLRKYFFVFVWYRTICDIIAAVAMPIERFIWHFNGEQALQERNYIDSDGWMRQLCVCMCVYKNSISFLIRFHSFRIYPFSHKFSFRWNGFATSFARATIINMNENMENLKRIQERHAINGEACEDFFRRKPSRI